MAKCREQQSSQTRNHFQSDEDLREEAQEQHIYIWEDKTCQKGTVKGRREGRLNRKNGKERKERENEERRRKIQDIWA